MAKTIVGLDIGHWSIKVTQLDLRDHSIIDFQEYLHPTSDLSASPPVVDPIGSAQPESSLEHHSEPVDSSAESPHPSPHEGTEEKHPVWLPTLSKLSDSPVILEAEFICCNVPSHLVTFLQIPVPFEEEEKVATILPSLLDSRLTTDLKNFFWSFYVEKKSAGGDDTQPFQARVAVVERAGLTTFLAQLRDAGVDPNYVVFSPLAVAEALNFQGFLESFGAEELATTPQKLSTHSNEGANAIAFLDLGHQTATLTVVDQSESVASIATARTTQFGIQNYVNTVARDLDIEPIEAMRTLHEFSGFLLPANAEELPSQEEFERLEAERRFIASLQKSLRPLVRDVRRSLQGLFAQSKVQVGTVYLLGGGSKVKGLAEELSRQLGVSVVLFPTTQIATPLQHVRQNILSWGLSVAASQAVVRRRTCNFRKGPFAYRGRSSFLQKQVLFGGIALLIIILLSFGIIYSKKASIIAQRDAMKRELSLKTKTLFGSSILNKSKISTLLDGKGEGSEKRLIPTRSAFEIGYDIIQHIPSDIDLNVTRFEVDTRRSVVQLRGDTTDAQAVDQLVSSIEQIRCIKDIKKERLNINGSRADFELQINTEGCS